MIRKNILKYKNFLPRDCILVIEAIVRGGNPISRSVVQSPEQADFFLLTRDDDDADSVHPNDSLCLCVCDFLLLLKGLNHDQMRIEE